MYKHSLEPKQKAN